MPEPPPETVEAYLAACPPEARAAIERIRQIVRDEAPGAEEAISYRMPAFKLGGVLLYVGAFRRHIGLYPPVRGDATLMADLAPYAGEKGNLGFPLDAPIPWELIRRVVRARRHALEKAAADRRSRTSKPAPKRKPAPAPRERS